MVSLWWSQSALDEKIDQATSELLPTNQEDITLHFTISDQIRSKKVNSKDAMRALKRRLQHRNPNVQLAALSLTDTCVKNAGDTFVREIASREFMESLTSILHSSDCNMDVKNKILAIIQTWAVAAKSNPSLSYLTDTYQLLQHERFQFPPLTERVNALLLETAAPPEWTDSDVCERCRTPFTFTNRKHHCRNCGGTFCQECSSKNLPLPHLAIDELVRVCYGCYVKLKLSRVAKKGSVSPHRSSSHSNMPALTSGPSPEQHPARATPACITNEPEDKRFEDDLKRAIELSKVEAKQYEQHYAPAITAIRDTKTGSDPQYEQSAIKEQEEDPELAAAIAASLRDMEDAQRTELEYYYSQQSGSERANKNELSNTEMENIELFAMLMERVSATDMNTMDTDEQINQLYTQIGTLQPKLIKNLDDAIQKHNQYATLHEKLNNAVKAYDRLLEQRVANSYQRAPSTAPRQYGAPPLQQIPSVYDAYSATAPQSHPAVQQQHQYPACQRTALSVYPTNAHAGESAVPYSPQPHQPFATSPRPTTLSPTEQPLSSLSYTVNGTQPPFSAADSHIPTQDPMASADQPHQRRSVAFPQTVSAVGDNRHSSYYNTNLGQWVINGSHEQQSIPPQPQASFPSAPTHDPQQQQQMDRRAEETSLIDL